MRAVIYARYSSGPNQTDQSIEGQVRDCLNFAKQNNLTVVSQYIDKAVSGKFDNRESFQNMISDSEKNIFDAVILWKTDRFARNRYDSAIYKTRLKRNGIKIYYAAEPLPDGPAGIIMESLLEGMAEYYSAELSQKIKRGVRESAIKGKVLGSPPLGYKKSEEKTYMIDEKTAPVVQKIFKMYDSGITVTEICKVLNSQGLKTSRGAMFNKNSLRKMLKNEKYIGIYNAAGITHNDKIPPIIDKALFNKVQQRFKDNMNMGNPHLAKTDYLLSAKVICGDCDSKFIGMCGSNPNGVRYYYYSCGGKRRGEGCRKGTVKKAWLEDLVVKSTLEFLTPDMIQIIADKCADIYATENSNTSELDYLNKQLASNKNSINNIMMAIEAGIFNNSTKQRLDELEEANMKLEYEISICTLKKPTITSEHIVFMLESLAVNRCDSSIEEYHKNIIDALVNKVYLYDNKMLICFNLFNEKRELQSSLVRFLNDSPPPPSTDKHQCSTRVNVNGDEENRTPVQKPIHKNFSHHSY